MGNSSYNNHNASVLNNLSVGDLVQFPRGVYSHWAVYYGNRQVIHLAGDDNDGVNAGVHSGHMFSICGIQYSKAKVCIDDFWTVAKGSKARKNNTRDRTWRPFSPADIVSNATSQLGQVGFNLWYSNCEHFAKWCRYGMSKSDQVEQAITGVAAIGLGAFFTGWLYYLFGNSNNNEAEEEEKQKTKQMKS